MSDHLEELINYRLGRASDALEEVEALANIEHWNACINRLYYACFYAVIALLIKHNLSSSKHSGVRSLFNKEFVKSGIIDKDFSKWLHKAFDLRQGADYQADYQVTTELAEMTLNNAVAFVNEIKSKIVV